MRGNTILCFIIPLILAGCSSAPKRPYAIKDNGLLLYTTDNDQKMLFVKDVELKDGHRFCLTPPHDAVGAGSSGVSLGVGAAGVKEGLSFGNAKSEISLGGRSPSVLISRELMYRACELSSNLNSDESTTLKIYERFLQTVEKVSLNQTETGTEPLSMIENTPVRSLSSREDDSTAPADYSGEDDQDDYDDDSDSQPDPEVKIDDSKAHPAWKSPIKIQ